MRRSLSIAVLISVILFSFLTPVAAGDIVFSTPVYLNGSSIYSYNGTSALCNLAADAARAAADADIALLCGNMVAGSLPEGTVSGLELNAALASGNVQLIETELTSSELVTILDEQMIQGSRYFPQISGFHVLASRKLTDSGAFCGDVQNLFLSDDFYDNRFDLVGKDIALKVVTTQELYDVYQMNRKKENLNISLYDAMVSFLEPLAEETIEEVAHEERIQIAGDTLNLPLILQKLILRVPTSVVCNLTTPDIVPDSVMYALSGQDRWLSCRFPLEDIPYSLSIFGENIRIPTNVNTEIAVTQELPAGRKTANMFDDNTVFVDLRGNDTVPEGSVVTADLSAIYAPNTTLYLYYYNENGDILPMTDASQTATHGRVTFPVSPSTTYIINSRQLNDSISGLFVSPDHPFIPGMLACIALFAVWLIVFLLVQRAKQKKRTASADGK